MALAQLVNSTHATFSNDIVSTRDMNRLTIDGEVYTINANKLRELEMRINVLENHIRAQEALKDKYIVVLGE